MGLFNYEVVANKQYRDAAARRLKVEWVVSPGFGEKRQPFGRFLIELIEGECLIAKISEGEALIRVSDRHSSSIEYILFFLKISVRVSNVWFERSVNVAFFNSFLAILYILWHNNLMIWYIQSNN